MSYNSQPLAKTLAFDFDGILCNGLTEYFQTAWKVYRQTWPDTNPTPPDNLAETFNRLRPVVEVGWEMPMVIRAVLQGIEEATIISQWSTLKTQLVLCLGL